MKINEGDINEFRVFVARRVRTMGECFIAVENRLNDPRAHGWFSETVRLRLAVVTAAIAGLCAQLDAEAGPRREDLQ